MNCRLVGCVSGDLRAMTAAGTVESVSSTCCFPVQAVSWTSYGRTWETAESLGRYRARSCFETRRLSLVLIMERALPEPFLESWSGQNPCRCAGAICGMGNLTPDGEALHGGETSRRFCRLTTVSRQAMRQKVPGIFYDTTRETAENPGRFRAVFGSETVPLSLVFIMKRA